ncbi:hypothetical protein NMY22_g706 [Coprinellus aureogranulatus]|nr:hypothetical protein NMY22_g706 [Coprinellus aureogranulatus]
MCYAAGSIDAVNPCPMCKVFPHSRCPHVRDTCRNRAHHPRMDVLYIKNAEVDRFNGCGYCKWAKMNPTPPPEFLRYNNPGWPGCCRPPFPTEYSSIPAADWRAVSAVHNVPIPPNIQAVLDTLQSRGPPMPPFLSPASPTGPGARASARTGSDRRNAGGSSPSTKVSSLAKGAVTTNGKARLNGSPQATAATLSRTPSGSAISSSAPSSPSSPEEKERERGHNTPRNGVDTPKRRIDSSNSSLIGRTLNSRNHLPLPVAHQAVHQAADGRQGIFCTPAIVGDSAAVVPVTAKGVALATFAEPRPRLDNPTGPKSSTWFVDLETILSEEDRTSTILLQGPLDTLQKIAFQTDCLPVGAEGVPAVNGRVEAVGVAV